MQYAFDSTGASGWATLTAKPVDADGYPPLEAVRVRWPMSIPQIDRIAVASALIFSPWAVGRMDLQTPCSALTAQRLTEWSQSHGQWISISNIRAGGLPIPVGTKSAEIVESPCSNLTTDSNFRLFFGDTLSGSSHRSSQCQVASNINVLECCAPSVEIAYQIRLGLAVLVAEALDITRFSFPAFQTKAPIEFEHARRLLECVSLGLVRS